MAGRTPQESRALRIFLVAAALTFVASTQQGCGASHVGEIIGIDPKPTTEATTVATVTPTTI